MSRALFIHVPRITGERREIMVMPQGLIPLASICEDAGVTTRVIHAGLAGLDDARSLAALVGKYEPGLIFLPVHWHQQAGATVEAVSLLSKKLPGVPMVAGGLAASVFAGELMGLAPGLAAVIRGDGEAAVSRIARFLARDAQVDWAKVPNAVWRGRDGVVHDNGITFVLSRRGASKLRHARFDLMIHPGEYIGAGMSADFYGPAFHYSPGRGCTYGCSFCGGSRISQTTVTGRSGYFFYGAGKVIRDLLEARSFGLESWRVSFDPGRRRDEWLRLARAINREGMRWRMVFDAWSPPSQGLTPALASIAMPGSVVVLSPETGNQRLRMRLKGPFHSDADYEAAAEEAVRHGFGVHLFVSAGLPGEKIRDVELTAAMVRKFRKWYGASVTACQMELNPGSRMHVSPKRHSVRLSRFRLADFINPRDPVGYQSDGFSTEEIMEAITRLQAEAGE
ncbi:MAG: radical SAM protein [Myxococcota bacterium]|jgi:radical SAM superfamily enzyme YgiQ (UPF0313 family)